MELKLLLLLLSTFYLISCVNSAIIYNDKISEDNDLSHDRVHRSSNTWDSEEQQEGLRHENVIYISLPGSSERSKESLENKDHPLNLWNILGKTTEVLVTPFIKAFLPRTFPLYVDYDNTLWQELKTIPPEFPPKIWPTSNAIPPGIVQKGLPTKYDPPPINPDSLGARSAERDELSPQELYNLYRPNPQQQQRSYHEPFIPY